MGNAAFVLIAVAVSAVGSLLLWLYHRRPRTFTSSIDDFQREMKALSRNDEEQQTKRRSVLRARASARRGPSAEGD